MDAQVRGRECRFNRGDRIAWIGDRTDEYHTERLDRTHADERDRHRGASRLIVDHITGRPALPEERTGAFYRLMKRDQERMNICQCDIAVAR